MKNLRTQLPPLDTLIFFEAVIRNGGFTAASAELYVSQAAVSKRIRQLEDWLATDLFERGTRSLTPTPAGKALAEPVAMALDYLRTSLEGIKSPPRASVRIAANNAVSMFWLFPRLKAFTLSQGSCPVETIVTNDPTDLLSPDNDLAIVYADAPPTGWVGQKLMDEELAPMSSPRGVQKYRQDPQSMPLLEYERYAPDWINWDVWAKRHSTSALLELPKVVCQTYGQSIGRAIAGEGIALVSCTLLRNELASNALQRLDEGAFQTRKGYFLVQNSSCIERNDVEELAGFLLGAD
ncbi:LysR family transcriptional regulator [Pacificibacter sp. AS14]|uniref:LysR family transcriptional regulator n=1 Tax=Pacificibacter sp. AS14 TaxID=3135785 RepID=UPI003178A503